MKKRLLCLSDLFPAFLYDECPLSPAEVIHSPCRGRANAPETFTRILSFIIMKSVNYPHAKRVRRPKGLKAISQITRKRIISLAFAIRTATYER